MVLRHGAVEGLKEICKNFQVALFSFLGEKTIKFIVEHLLTNDIVFDGVYTRVQAHGRTDEFANYNQIYADFDIVNNLDTLETRYYNESFS